jgi:hypothetical protein
MIPHNADDKPATQIYKARLRDYGTYGAFMADLQSDCSRRGQEASDFGKLAAHATAGTNIQVLRLPRNRP